MDWYYVENGESRGPVSADELARLIRAGQLQADSLVWTADFGETWKRVCDVPAFQGLRMELPPVSVTRRRVVGDAPPPGRVSLTAPVSAAWDGMKTVLFRPFDSGRWFLLGFSAWLAGLGQTGGSFNWNPGRGGGNGAPGGQSVEQALAQVRAFWAEYGALVLSVGLAALVAGLVLGVLLLWVRSRGKFMFLDNVVNNRTEIQVPWRAYAAEGNSLFRWTLVYGVLCLAVVAVILGLGWWLVAAPCLAYGRFVPGVVPGLVLVLGLFTLFGFINYYVMRFLEDFVVPLMYRDRLTASAAWRRFGALYRQNRGGLLLYGLFVILLQMAAGMAILAFAVVTCFIGACLMLVPYLGAVVLLPVSVFFRLYSLEYLAQYGDGFVVGGAEPGSAEGTD